MREHYATHGIVPAPDESALNETVKAAVAESVRRHAAQEKKLFAPSVVDLVFSQLRTTKFLVWIIQAAAVVLALVFVVGREEQAQIFGTIGAASAILAGLSVAGMTFDQNASLVEMSYSFHFNYRQIVLTRMLLYGFVDLIGLIALTLLGSSLSPLGLSAIAPGVAEVLLCSATTFFATGFACLFAISRYQGGGVLLLCSAVSLVIVLATILLFRGYSNLLFSLPILYWLLLIAVVVIGLILCARSFFSKINAGYEHIRS